MMSLTEAKLNLRIDADNTANDALILGLIATMPDYIELTTGMSKQDQLSEPLVDTVSAFLLKLWYYAGHADDNKLQRTIDALLKCITLKTRGSESVEG